MESPIDAIKAAMANFPTRSAPPVPPQSDQPAAREATAMPSVTASLVRPGASAQPPRAGKGSFYRSLARLTLADAGQPGRAQPLPSAKIYLATEVALSDNNLRTIANATARRYLARSRVADVAIKNRQSTLSQCMAQTLDTVFKGFDQTERLKDIAYAYRSHLLIDPVIMGC